MDDIIPYRPDATIRIRRDVRHQYGSIILCLVTAQPRKLLLGLWIGHWSTVCCFLVHD